MTDTYDLQRFVDAQDPVYARVLSELGAGQKQSHWMWFVFPQIAGLGHSAMAQKYAISSRDEAAAYLSHKVLGPRLRECMRLVISVPGKSIESILGQPDNVKFLSSMTLFAQATGENEEFVEAVRKYFDGHFDQATIDRLHAISNTDDK